jgi:hypothetical protein
VWGLNKRCPVRFTIDFIDTRFDRKHSYEIASEITHKNLFPFKPTSNNSSLSSGGHNNNNNNNNNKPCAFLGAFLSLVSAATLRVANHRNHPQISGKSTSDALDNNYEYPLSGRTAPNIRATSPAILRFYKDVWNVDHLAVINTNDKYGYSFVAVICNLSECP